jgi:hypothetical protein
MNAIAASKSPQLNRLEGFALSAIFQGFPTIAMAVLILKAGGSHEIVGERYGAAIFVVLSTIRNEALQITRQRTKTPMLFRGSGNAQVRGSRDRARPSRATKAR